MTDCEESKLTNLRFFFPLSNKFSLKAPVNRSLSLSLTLAYTMTGSSVSETLMGEAALEVQDVMVMASVLKTVLEEEMEEEEEELEALGVASTLTYKLR